MDDGHAACTRSTARTSMRRADREGVFPRLEVASVGIRPGSSTAGPRQAHSKRHSRFSAARGKPYELPFSGGVSGCTASRERVHHAVSRERKAPLFDMTRVCAGREGLRILRQLAPSAAITSSGRLSHFPCTFPTSRFAPSWRLWKMPLAKHPRDLRGVPVAHPRAL